MEKYEINIILEKLNKILNDLEKVIDVKKQKQHLQELNNLLNTSDFWNDWDKAKLINQEFKNLQHKVNEIQRLKISYQDLSFLLTLTAEQTDDFAFLIQELILLKQNIHNFEIEVLLNKPYDIYNAIITLTAGAGGSDAQDWCEILFRMYQKYSQKKHFKIEILDCQLGDIAGFKKILFLIKGLNVYGYLKSEKGIHRLIRISPFNANSKRHTSFASFEILPEINDNIDIKLQEEDLKIDFFKSSGAGGQHVNTTDSAIRITHLPTNIVVSCQNERSQNRNKQKALKILKIKLSELERQKKKNNEKLMKGEQKEISWGNQIRSYIFHPYKMVKDHRTKLETFQIEDVMDGNLDEFIINFLKLNI